MKNNDFSLCILRRTHSGILAVCLLIFIFAGVGSAATHNLSITEREDPCKGTGAPEHCIPPSYWMNAGTYTTVGDSQDPSPVWSDTIGEYYAHVEMSGDGNSVVAGSDTGMLRIYDRSGKVLWTYSSSNSSVYTVAISSDGEHIAASFSDPTKPSNENEWQIRFFDGPVPCSGHFPAYQHSPRMRWCLGTVRSLLLEAVL